MQKIIGKLIMLVAIFCAISCGSSKSEESDFAGTYKVYDSRTSYSLVLNEDGSVCANVDGETVAYGHWEYYDYDNHENMCYISMDDNFRFFFGYSRPVLDPNTNRLYLSLQAYKNKNPNKYFRVEVEN